MTTSMLIQLSLIAIYIVLIGVSLVEHQPGKALYWFGATCIVASVIVMRG